MLQENSEQTLHTLNKTSCEILVNQQLSHTIQDGDSIVLIEDGVYQCLKMPAQTENHWSGTARSIYVLSADAEARGVQFNNIKNEKVYFIDYQTFVELTLKHKKVVSWY